MTTFDDDRTITDSLDLAALRAEACAPLAAVSSWHSTGEVSVATGGRRHYVIVDGVSFVASTMARQLAAAATAFGIDDRADLVRRATEQAAMSCRARGITLTAVDFGVLQVVDGLVTVVHTPGIELRRERRGEVATIGRPLTTGRVASDGNTMATLTLDVLSLVPQVDDRLLAVAPQGARHESLPSLVLDFGHRRQR